MSPNEEVKPMVENNAEMSAPKKPKKKLKVVAAVIAVVLVLGGITAALVVRSIYNKPENVLAIALSDYLLDGKDKNFDYKVSVDLEEALMGVKNVSLGGNVQMSGKTTQIELNVDASIISLKGAIQSNENGNLYVKIDDLPSLLASGAGEAYGLTAEMSTQVAALDGKWIEIKPEDLTALTGKEAGSSAFDKCTDVLYAAMDNEDLGNSVDKTYKKNKFLTVKSESTETVNGKELLKMEVGLDKTKLASFSEELGKSEQAMAVLDKCGLKNEEAKVETDTSGDELKNGKVTVWVDRAEKQLVKLEASGDSYSDGVKAGDLSVTMDVKAPGGKIEVPGDTVNIVTLMQGFGIDPSMFGGAAQ